MAEDTGIPLAVRVELTHAAVQVLANHQAVDLLHIKGPTVAAGLRNVSTGGTDADVLVRPGDVRAFLKALRGSGWQLLTDFTQGSAFEHAATLYHPNWGLLDVHRRYPGLDRDPDRSFAVLWERRQSITLAAQAIPVPDRTAQALILLLHAARSGPLSASDHPDYPTTWGEVGPDQREAMTALAIDLDAQVGLAAATGRLSEFAGPPEAALWRLFTQQHSRLDEWRARLQAAPTRRAKVSVVARSFVVNRYFLEESLGRPATRVDVVKEFSRRLGHARRDVVTIARRSLRRGP